MKSESEEIVRKFLVNNAPDSKSLSVNRIKTLKQKWRKIYSENLFKQKRVWRYNQYDWHVFSWNLTKSLSDFKAIRAILSKKESEWYIWGDRNSEFGMRVRGITPINLSGLYEDYILSSIDLSWTIAFTHESTCGPYYSNTKMSAQQSDTSETMT